ncbi:MAG: M20/M25/M40 family metallo-hydrolase, partial [Clostridia bacterium]|nr:M20/M25/M40 family metallo-hydrolase [Clostridia bacterium]
ANKAQKREALQTVQRVADSVSVEGCRCEWREISYRPPMEYCEKNKQLLDKMNAIYAANGMPELTPRTANGGSDAAYVTEHGIPCVDALGVAGGPIHTKNEYVTIESIADAAKRVASVIYCL